MLSHEQRPKPGEPPSSRGSTSGTISSNKSTLTRPFLSSSASAFSTYAPSHHGRLTKHTRYASHPTSNPSSLTHLSFAAQARAAAIMKDDHQAAHPREYAGLEPISQAKPSAQPSTTITPTRSASTSSSTASTPRSASLSSTTSLDHATAIRRVADLEAALATARTHQHRLAMELERLRMAAATNSRRPSAPSPSVPSIFASPSSFASAGDAAGGTRPGGDEWGVTNLMAEAARNCERAEDRLVFQRQIVVLRDKIYAQAEELSERKREKREWVEEREMLRGELKAREDRIRGLEMEGGGSAGPG
ncbi:hypothetical protein GTA08_BOTSDO00465 [Neofusicoccum parvum]|uniref:Uncharacterized protein n=1 Tax=Neofusicoccum parvum TaxID=310453 RepID=A0ACB5SMU0_9PEZI|nr:hypothetical protein GTA08_BOTSDO00465 [Neofusicoccum parvum]